MTRPKQQRETTDVGAAAVEMALIAPILFTIVFGIISFGSAYSTKITMTGGVREGARVIALGGTDAAAKVRVQQNTAGLNPPMGDADIVIVTDCPTNAGSSAQAKVTASYDMPYNYIFGGGTWHLVTTGVMRCGL